MNRQDLQNLSRMRVREAKTLLDAGNYPGSYYLMGYAVECAIKAVIARQVNRYDFPNKKLAQDSYSHDLTSLFKTAGLWGEFERARQSASALDVNWATVKDWNETTRYVTTTSELQARDLHSACVARKHGLLSWLKIYC